MQGDEVRWVDSEVTQAGAAVTTALDDGGCGAVVLAPGPVDAATRRRLASLLSGPHAIGAVVPAVVGGDRRPLGAGLVVRGDRLVDRLAASSDPAAGETAADVQGSAWPWVAFRRALLAGRPIDPDAAARQVAAAAMASAADRGLRCVFEPTWSVPAPAAAAPGVGPARVPSPPAKPEIVVVTGFLPSSSVRGDDSSVETLLDDLLGEGAASLTVVALDGFLGGPAARRWRSCGVEVVAGPCDWPAWWRAHWGRFDHVVLTRSALLSPVADMLSETQPHAARTLYLETLPSRDPEAYRSACPADELDGLDAVVGAGEQRLARWARQATVTMCAREADADLVRGLVPDRLVLVVPPDVSPIGPGSTLGFADRSGLVVMAGDGHDVSAANEAAAIKALETVVRPLREAGSDVEVTVLSDCPTPALATLVDTLGLRLAPMRQSSTVLGGARLVLALHDYGTGGPSVVVAAMRSGTPFVASPHATAALGIGALGVVTSKSALRHRVAALLADPVAWDDGRAALAGAVRDHFDPDRRRDQVRRWLTALGTVPTGRADWPAPTTLAAAARRPAVPPPLLRPIGPGTAYHSAMQDGDPTDAVDSNERYATWLGKHGPTPAVLDAIGGEVERLHHRPVISVVMPVYETDADVLGEAIASVRAQLYPHWELCIADDGSERRETLEVLASLGGDPRVKVTHIANSGISGATNAALAMATGDYVAFMDHDDLLKPHALAQVARWIDSDPDLDVVYSDEDKIDPDGRLVQPHLKPDWSPDLLMSVNFVSHLTVVRRRLVADVGGLRPGFDGSQDYDLLLRVTERTDRIAHIPEPLYTWRIIPGSAAEAPDAKPYALVAAKKALREALARRGRPGTVEDSPLATVYRTRYDRPGTPKVSIIIPTKDAVDLLRPCVESVVELSTYTNYEIVVVDNQSTDGRTLEWLARSGVKVIRYPHRFNYARQMNLAAASVEADALLFLNNDTEVISPSWIEALLEHAMRPEVGAVGGRLYYADGRIQHEGILVGVGGWAWNVDHRDYFARGNMVRNTSAVTGACTMVRPTVYARVGGNDEHLRIAYNDVDLCLRIRQAGLQVVYTPYAELHHYEGATRRGWEHDEDGPFFGDRWRPRELVDPYYSPLFERDQPFLIAT